MKALWLAVAGTLPIASPLHAQGGFSTLPYCAQYADGASLDCSFTTLSQCYRSVSGVGGVCVDNPTASGTSGGAAAAPQRPFGSPYAFAPSPVPPPPIQQSPGQPSQGVLPLPEPPPQQAQAQPSAGMPAQPPPACNPLYSGTYCASASSNTFAPASSLASDLRGASAPSATMGGNTFSGDTDCVGILRPLSCGG